MAYDSDIDEHRKTWATGLEALPGFRHREPKDRPKFAIDKGRQQERRVSRHKSLKSRGDYCSIDEYILTVLAAMIE